MEIMITCNCCSINLMKLLRQYGISADEIDLITVNTPNNQVTITQCDGLIFTIGNAGDKAEGLLGVNEP